MLALPGPGGLNRLPRSRSSVTLSSLPSLSNQDQFRQSCILRSPPNIGVCMRAWRIPSFGIDHLELAQCPDPQPGRGEVLVRVHAVSLNYRDLMVTLGHYNPKMRLPRIPCSDGAGEVVAVGEGVTRVKTGDRVAAIFMQNWLDGTPDAAKIRGALGGDIDGMLAELVVLREEGVVLIPPHLSYEQAATLPCAAVTAWNALVHAGQIKSGDTVVIQGTGGVSIFALQFAKQLGARVLGTSSSDEKLARAANLGLDAGLNYRDHPDWDKWVMAETDGRGADLIVEVGGAGTFSRSLRAVRIGGAVAQIGVLSQSEESIEIPLLLHRQVRLRGIYVGSRANFEEMNRAISQHHLQPVVDKVFSLEQFPQALTRMEGKAHFGKLVTLVMT
jgi:NADPH:quinone reductase-like Zn-dependent oxidoreductase